MTSPSHRRAAGARRALLGSVFVLVSGAAQSALLVDDFEDGVARYTATGVAGAMRLRSEDTTTSCPSRLPLSMVASFMEFPGMVGRWCEG